VIKTEYDEFQSGLGSNRLQVPGQRGIMSGYAMKLVKAKYKDLIKDGGCIAGRKACRGVFSSRFGVPCSYRV